MYHILAGLYFSFIVASPGQGQDISSCSTTGDIRLLGTDTQGRVEICLNGRWGAVCDNLWSGRDAQVACRQLGFSSAAEVLQSSSSRGNTVWLDSVQCSGSEERLIDCPSGAPKLDCETARIQCSKRDVSALATAVGVSVPVIGLIFVFCCIGIVVCIDRTCSKSARTPQEPRTRSSSTRRSRHSSDSSQSTINFGGFKRPVPPPLPPYPLDKPPVSERVDGLVSPPPSYNVVQENKDRFTTISLPPPYPSTNDS